MIYKTVKPFVKWAGGKSQLLNTIREKYLRKIDKYCEPFVGGGAVLLDVLANCQPKEILINDRNAELVNTYSQIKNNVDELIEMLFEMQETFWSKPAGIIYLPFYLIINKPCQYRQGLRFLIGNGFI